MSRKLLLAGLLIGIATGASAQIRNPATGAAEKWIVYGCDPCCYVTNKHAEKTIHATLFSMMFKHETRIQPGQTVNFPIRDGCMKGAMGLEVNFAN